MAKRPSKKRDVVQQRSGTRDSIEWVPIESLKAYDRNTRTHTAEQIEQLRHSFREFGWVNPVLVTADGTIVAGHARIEAAKLEGYETAKTMVVDGMSPTQIRAYVIADNRLALDAGWDEALLKLEFEALAAEGFDNDLLGFTGAEIEAFLNPGTPAGDDVDRAPEPPAAPVSQAMDVWLLGEDQHRIVCGSCTDPASVQAVLRNARPHLMVTDPPYGVSYNPDWRNDAAKAGTIGMKGIARSVGKVENDDRADWREAWALFPGDVAYVWSAPGPLTCDVKESLDASDLIARMGIIWAKDRPAIGRGHYHNQHEVCWYAVRKGKSASWEGGRKQSTLWEIRLPWDNYGNRIPGKEDEKNGHGTQKPVECMKRPIENNSRPGQEVYDPFSGSGTTIIAAEMTGRRCYAIELNAAYVDVAVMRWENFTGRKAIHAETGETFDQVRARRYVPA